MTTSVYATPEEAELAFYEAFQSLDLPAMMNVWADREFIECIHPMSDRLQGRSGIEAGWRDIFASGLRVRIDRTQVHRTQDALIAVHVLYEHLRIPGEQERHPPVVATNIYQFIEGSWRMVLHHASPSGREEPAEEAEAHFAHKDKRHLH